MFGFVLWGWESKLNSDLSSLSTTVDGKVTTGAVGRVSGLTIGGASSKNYIYQESNGVMWIRYVDASGNVYYTNFNELKKSVVDGKQLLLNGVNRYWNVSSNWKHTAEETSWGDFYNMYQIVYESGVLAGGSGKYTCKSGTGSMTPGSNAIKSFTISTGLSSIANAGVSSNDLNMSVKIESFSGGTINCSAWGRYGGTYTYRWAAYGS